MQPRSSSLRKGYGGTIRALRGDAVREAAIDAGIDLLWLILGGCALVTFAFFLLIRYWQRLLQHHTWTIRQLSRRVQELEGLGDPAFRRRLEETAPVPLESVFTLTFRFSQKFWNDTLGLGEEDERFIRECGSFVGSVKLERWRSHSVASVTEVLPASQGARWQTRTLHFFSSPAADNEGVQLWELILGPADAAAHRADSLELQIVTREHCDCIELRARHSRSRPLDSGSPTEPLFSIPLDRAMLASRRAPEPVAPGDPECAWKGFYSFQDEVRGIEWQLWMQDLTRKAEWERWKIVETEQAS